MHTGIINEECRPIDGHPNYQVSDIGRGRHINGEILKTHLGQFNLYRITLRKHGRWVIHKFMRWFLENLLIIQISTQY